MSKNQIQSSIASKSLILCFAIAVVYLHSLPVLSQSPPRVWKDASGKFEINGRLVKSDDKNVTIDVKDKGELEVPVDKLCDADRKYVLGLGIVQQDEAQFRLAMAHLERFRESPTAVMEILGAIHENYPKAPYASAMLGIAYAADRADYRTAEKHLRMAAKSIESRQKILGEDYHKLTQLAVNNNLAVVYMKLGKCQEAVKLFESNTELTKEQINFCSYHNATLLLEAVNQRGSVVSLPSSSRKKLVQMLATTPPANPEFQVPAALLYMLEWSQPLTKSSLERMLSGKTAEMTPTEKSTHVSGAVFQTEDELVKRGYRPHVQGTGFLVTPDLVVTNRNVVQSAENNLSYTITQYQEDGNPTLVGGSVVKWSPVQDEDLAIIRLDQGVNSEPLRIIDNDGNPFVGTDITVLGFPEAFKTGEHLLASGGMIEDFNSRKSWFSLSANLLQGNSGGPCVDMYGNVCGVAFEKDRDDIVTFDNRDERQYELKGVAVSATPLVQFIKSVDSDYVQLPPHADKIFNRQNLTEHIRPSVFLIKSWKSPLTRQGNVGKYGDEIDARKARDLEHATLKENRLYPDLWCYHCRGAASLKCPNSYCSRGQVEKRKQVVVGRDPNFGTKIYAQKRYFERCPTCRGEGQIKCPHCREGKVKLK